MIFKYRHNELFSLKLWPTSLSIPTKAAEPLFFRIPCGYKCLGGYFKSIISKHSPDFLFLCRTFRSKALNNILDKLGFFGRKTISNKEKW